MIEVLRQRTQLFSGRSAHQNVLVIRVGLRGRKSKQREHQHHNQASYSHDLHPRGDGTCEEPQTRRSDIPPAFGI
jgi:hypothetical protein